MSLMKNLRTKLASDSLKHLVLNGHDEEVTKGMSFFCQKQKLEEQSKHILKALETLDHYQDMNIVLTWEKYCEMVVSQLLSKYSGRNFQSWFATCKLNNMFLPISK